jgi:hypothetical protein
MLTVVMAVFAGLSDPVAGVPILRLQSTGCGGQPAADA